jgi:methionine salvage enolase-phosphatase E1
MNTYNISVNGNEIMSQVPQSNLQENLKLIRGIVWTSGGNDGDIQVSLNKDETICNE